MMIPEDKLDLIIEILRQHDKRFDYLEKARDDDRAENTRRFEQIEKRFEQIDKRFEQIDRQFVELKEEIKEMRHDVGKDKDKLQEVYEARDRVSVSFTRAWTTASFFIALIASTIVLAVVKAF